MKKYPPKMICVSINMEKTGANMKKIITGGGYTVEDIMTITGVSTPQAVYKWFRGKSIPSIETLVVLSEVFGTSIRNMLVIDGDFGTDTEEAAAV